MAPGWERCCAMPGWAALPYSPAAITGVTGEGSQHAAHPSFCAQIAAGAIPQHEETDSRQQPCLGLMEDKGSQMEAMYLPLCTGHLNHQTKTRFVTAHQDKSRTCSEGSAGAVPCAPCHILTCTSWGSAGPGARLGGRISL